MAHTNHAHNRIDRAVRRFRKPTIRREIRIRAFFSAADYREVL